MTFSSIESADSRGFFAQDGLNSLRHLLKILVHLSTGEKSQAEKIIEETGGSLQSLFWEVRNGEIGDIRREACLILSNIVLKNEKASQALVDDEECLMKILEKVKEDFIEVGREGMWILVNLTKRMNFGKITKLVEHGILDCFVEILDEDDVESVELGLEGIMNVLEWGDVMANCQGQRKNLFVEELKMNGGIGKIDDLQWIANEEIHRKAEEILDEFFGDEEEYDGCEISVENE